MYKITLEIDGMKCGMCEAHVNDVFRKNFKIKKIKSSHKNGITEIVCENKIEEASILEVINPTGYKVSSYSCIELKK